MFVVYQDYGESAWTLDRRHAIDGSVVSLFGVRRVYLWLFDLSHRSATVSVSVQFAFLGPLCLHNHLRRLRPTSIAGEERRVTINSHFHSYASMFLMNMFDIMKATNAKPQNS